jgi:hypothetical protein
MPDKRMQRMRQSPPNRLITECEINAQLALFFQSAALAYATRGLTRSSQFQWTIRSMPNKMLYALYRHINSTHSTLLLFCISSGRKSISAAELCVD